MSLSRAEANGRVVGRVGDISIFICEKVAKAD